MEKRRDRACLFEHKNRFRVCNFGPGEPGLRLYNMGTCLVVSSNRSMAPVTWWRHQREGEDGERDKVREY